MSKYKTIEVDLDEKMQDTAIKIYVNKFFSEISQELFGDLLDKKVGIRDALYQAVLNEVVNISLKKMIEDNKDADVGE